MLTAQKVYVTKVIQIQVYCKRSSLCCYFTMRLYRVFNSRAVVTCCDTLALLKRSQQRAVSLAILEINVNVNKVLCLTTPNRRIEVEK